MVSAEVSMPNLVASTGMSSRTLVTCETTASGAIGSTAWTPWVFCEVSAVIAEVPYTASSLMDFRSAWIPAPPPESEPAMVKAVGGRDAAWCGTVGGSARRGGSGSGLGALIGDDPFAGVDQGRFDVFDLSHLSAEGTPCHWSVPLSVSAAHV